MWSPEEMQDNSIKKLGLRLTIKYVATHGLFWASYVCVGGFAALFLQGIGFSSTQVGVITAIGGVLALITQPFLAALTEEGGRLTLRQAMSLAAGAVTGMGILILTGPGMLAIACLFILIYAIMVNSSALLNSLGMEYVNMGVPLNYGMARGVGSAMYALLALSIGFLTERFGVRLLILGSGAFAFCLLLLLFTYESADKLEANYGLKKQQQTKQEKNGNMMQMLLENRRLLLLLIGILCIFISHNMINTYMINLVGRFGGADAQMGIAVAVAAGTELPSMMLANHMLKKRSSSGILRFSCLMFLVKGILLVGAVSMPILLLSQLSQFGAYAFFTPASVYYVNEAVPSHYKVTGQAALGMATMGLSGMFGNLLGGYLIDAFSAGMMSVAALLFVIAGTVFVFAGTAKTKNGFAGK